MSRVSRLRSSLLILLMAVVLFCVREPIRRTFASGLASTASAPQTSLLQGDVEHFACADGGRPMITVVNASTVELSCEDQPGDTPPQATGSVFKRVWYYHPGGMFKHPASEYAHIVLHRGDEAERDRMIRAGFKGTMLMYIVANQAKRADCDDDPTNNNAAYKPGDFCRLLREHPDWFYQRNGQPVCSGGTCMMRPDSGWTAFLAQRIKDLEEDHGWKGVFLDNIDGDPNRRQNVGDVDVEAYRRAVREQIRVVRQVTGRPVWANLTEQSYDTRREYLSVLDGAMDEGCVVDWHDGYKSLRSWQENMAFLQWAEVQQKPVMCIAQSDEKDQRRFTFAYASYLLVANKSTSFRYVKDTTMSPDDSYDHPDLGAPRGPFTREGDTYRREFERGRVEVIPRQHTASITVR